MIFKEAKKRINAIIDEWNKANAEDLKMNKTRYYVLVGGLMYADSEDDAERVERDIVSEMEYTQMMQNRG